MRIQRKSDEAIAAQLGESLRERRLRKDITQDQLAERVGVSTPTIQKLEKGRGTLQLLIAVLREFDALDLLSSLIEPARASPLTAATTGKTGRTRALGAVRTSDGRVQVFHSTQPEALPKNKKQGTAKPLLIPRKK
ncbi:helix-turn-helix domain-containing protein [Pseudomonas sp. COR58]|uniref:Helix-turn-helix domain-containing protein n=1 Tax=Pseudomonas ekonensis TaxID=2842353 RepID=A0ABS6PIP8_9PSED|nr:helix-turn-helix transcriptional regulator [Pseudomonas ekonensis]MBV4460350.1 helix-turn-helix domain-containing protein [Pseudomonas ekonensis]